MRHVNTEEIANYTDGQASEVERGLVESHIASCSDCKQVHQQLQVLINQLRDDSIFEPPASILQWGIQLFQPVQLPETHGKLRRFVASLVYDTYDQPMLAGVRRVGVPPRQLLFRAGEVDVDVKIESVEANERITLIGQVLSNATKFFDNTPVKLESHGVVRYRTKTNVVGEFSFDELPKDTYNLSVDLPEAQITLYSVNRSNI